MRLQLCSLLLNEQSWLEKNYLQHRNWPDMVAWVFVHGADRVYGQTNPDMVTADGFSVDGTGEILNRIAKEDSRVTVIHHGWMDNVDPAQGKCHGRNRYLDVAEEVKPDFLWIADLDEFHTHKAQAEISKTLAWSKPGPNGFHAFIFRQRHIFRPPSISHKPLFELEAVSGYWGIPHVRGWRWEPGLRYLNHNWPSDKSGTFLIHKGEQYRADRQIGTPECVHLGYASSGQSRVAKHQYYVNRGEGKEGGRIGQTRQMYLACREAWERYQPGDVLPHGAKIVPYNGPVPEVFRNG